MSKRQVPVVLRVGSRLLADDFLLERDDQGAVLLVRQRMLSGPALARLAVLLDRATVILPEPVDVALPPVTVTNVRQLLDELLTVRKLPAWHPRRQTCLEWRQDLLERICW